MRFIDSPPRGILCSPLKHFFIYATSLIHPGDKIKFPVQWWTAKEKLELVGIDIRIVDAGLTYRKGQATVMFSDGSLSFGQKYYVNSTSPAGFNTTIIGASDTVTDYARLFPLNATREEVRRSFEGAFITYGGSTTPLFDVIGIEGGYTVGDDPTGLYRANIWKGWTRGGDVGVSLIPFSGGAAITNYAIPYGQ